MPDRAVLATKEQSSSMRRLTSATWLSSSLRRPCCFAVVIGRFWGGGLGTLDPELVCTCEMVQRTSAGVQAVVGFRSAALVPPRPSQHGAPVGCDATAPMRSITCLRFLTVRWPAGGLQPQPRSSPFCQLIRHLACTEPGQANLQISPTLPVPVPPMNRRRRPPHSPRRGIVAERCALSLKARAYPVPVQGP